MQGISYSAYALPALLTEDKTWLETGALEQLQAVCIISELLNFMVHAKAQLSHRL